MESIIVNANNDTTTTTNGKSDCNNSTEDSHDEQQSRENSLKLSLPWGVIADFIPFSESLMLRLVCRAWCSSLDDALSLTACSKFLVEYLAQENITILSRNLDLYWNHHQYHHSLLQNQQMKNEDIAKLLKSTDTTSTTTKETKRSLNKLVSVMKVLRNFPKQVAVAFSPKYGRHCVPLEWDPSRRESILQYSSPCQRTNCPTCELPIPHQNQSATTTTTTANNNVNNIANHLELRDNNGPLDLTCYTPKCVPNLPPDLTCPMCERTTERTLVLAEFCYQSNSKNNNSNNSNGTTATTATTVSPNRVPLQWDPSPTSAGETTNPSTLALHNRTTADDDNTESDEPSSKRQKAAPVPLTTNNDTTTTSRQHSFPPMHYDELAIPIRTEAIQTKPDTKSAMTIYCSKCYNFAIIAPAATCWNAEYCCHERGRHLEDGTILGCVINRSTCSMPDCFLPVPCHYCAHSNFHDSYHHYNDDRRRPGEGAGQSQRLLRRAAACDSCCKTYCSEHAWIATACHHW